MISRYICLLLGSIPIALSAVGAEPKSYSYRYKITVTAIDGGQTISSSNVVSVREQSINNAQMVPKLCGEATVVKLRNGNYLFALLTGPALPLVPKRQQWGGSPTQVLLQRLGLPTEWNYDDDSGIRRLSGIRQIVRLDSDQMPEFVAFRNLRDPRTIESIDPHQSVTSLNGNAKIESVTIQPTNEEITKDRIKVALPWFNPSRDFIDGSRWGREAKGYQSQQFSRCTDH
ncbi:MAG TPA: hypothetical protein VJQ48_03550 [Candidatus Binatia bacterium]|nr:hypothetical protein [Candidatus Binatia bacterium]